MLLFFWHLFERAFTFQLCFTSSTRVFFLCHHSWLIWLRWLSSWFVISFMYIFVWLQITLWFIFLSISDDRFLLISPQSKIVRHEYLIWLPSTYYVSFLLTHKSTNATFLLLKITNELIKIIFHLLFIMAKLTSNSLLSVNKLLIMSCLGSFLVLQIKIISIS